jgi:hypothetical protein
MFKFNVELEEEEEEEKRVKNFLPELVHVRVTRTAFGYGAIEEVS